MKSPEKITENLFNKSIAFVDKPLKELLIGGILAGIFVSIAAITSVTVCSDMSSYFGVGFTKLIFGVVFTLGLTLIVLSGSELFTGSNLYIVSVYKDKEYLKRVLRNWVLIYLSNFLGAIILIFFIFKTGVLDDELIQKYIINITEAKLNLTMVEVFFRGILCNFLVCLAVRVGEASEEVSGKIIGYIYVIGAFVINSFEHSIANMFFIPTGILVAAKSGIYIPWKAFFVGNLLPVTIGNIIGGGLFVGVIYHTMHSRYFNKNCISNKLKVIKGDKYENF
ncbi:MAG: formate/nitrite transporter family protein [Clostridium sp.]|nr:formate/nitrite transporter family protein [Clostridium sp.]